jgi:murein DD-endopeptidase MepM/ murein hydrolase activator NlpD
MVLLPLAVTPTRQVQAGIQPISTPVASIQSAPALVQDGAESLRRSLLARLEFEELSLQLLGVARFADQTACTIKHPGAAEAMIYRTGDVIGGYRIISIDQTSVTFERNDLKFYLTAGEASNGVNVADEDEAGEIDVNTPEGELRPADAPPLGLVAGPALDQMADPGVELKTASDDLKHKTRRFETAKLIEEVTADEDTGSGSSSRRRSSGMFAMPTTGRYSSGFGYRRHPLGGGIKFHRGVDLAAPYGTSVYAAADGVVEKSSWIPTLGNYVTINHANGYSTRYGHLSKRLIEPGTRVHQGDLIGRVGSTGQSTGNHLHFEVRKNQVALDPESFIKVRH